jgi:hypothetical protein
VQQLQGLSLPPLPQARLHVRRKTLLADSPPWQVLPVLRLVPSGRGRVHMPLSLQKITRGLLLRMLLPSVAPES